MPWGSSCFQCSSFGCLYKLLSLEWVWMHCRRLVRCCRVFVAASTVPLLGKIALERVLRHKRYSTPSRASSFGASWSLDVQVSIASACYYLYGWHPKLELYAYVLYTRKRGWNAYMTARKDSYGEILLSRHSIAMILVLIFLPLFSVTGSRKSCPWFLGYSSYCFCCALDRLFACLESLHLSSTRVSYRGKGGYPPPNICSSLFLCSFLLYNLPFQQSFSVLVLFKCFHCFSLIGLSYSNTLGTKRGSWLFLLVVKWDHQSIENCVGWAPSSSSWWQQSIYNSDLYLRKAIKW